MFEKKSYTNLAQRFRGFLPVVVDVETGGFNAETDALLEIAAVTIQMDVIGNLYRGTTHHYHILPFPGANLEPASLEVNHIDPYHPFRFAISEHEALRKIFITVDEAVRFAQCERAILVGHNANFDLSFLQSAYRRTHLENPFHQFATLDTVTLSALMFGETVLAKAMQAAGISFDRNEAHAAIYDAEKTADLFCWMFNRWQALIRNK